MFKEIFDFDAVAMLTRIALVIFVVMFVASVGWIVTRPRRDVRRWASLALEEGEMQEPQLSPVVVHETEKGSR